MIKKTILVTLLLLTGYYFLIPFMPGGRSLTQWQANLVKAQQYLIDYQGKYPDIIIGSSLSNRIITDSLPGFFNLGLDGLSIYDGLEVISASRSLPGKIFLEMNNAIRKKDIRFSSAIRQNFWFGLTRVLPFFREEYKPMVLMVTYIHSLYKAFEKEAGQTKSAGNHPEGIELFERALEQHIQRNLKRPPAELLSFSFSELKFQVSVLERKGVEFIFFVMPVDTRISALVRPRLIKQYAMYYFPAGENRWILPPSGKEYPTTDGVHLTGKSSRGFTSYFKSKID
jgi:hypothetical protein